MLVFNEQRGEFKKKKGKTTISGNTWVLAIGQESLEDVFLQLDTRKEKKERDLFEVVILEKRRKKRAINRRRTGGVIEEENRTRRERREKKNLEEAADAPLMLSEASVMVEVVMPVQSSRGTSLSLRGEDDRNICRRQEKVTTRSGEEGTRGDQEKESSGKLLIGSKK